MMLCSRGGGAASTSSACSSSACSSSSSSSRKVANAKRVVRRVRIGRGKRRDEELSKTRFTRRENQDDGVRFRRGRRRRADALPARPGECEGREEPERDPSQSDK